MITYSDLINSDDFGSLSDDEKTAAKDIYYEEYGDSLTSIWDELSSSEDFDSLSLDEKIAARDIFSETYGVTPELDIDRTFPGTIKDIGITAAKSAVGGLQGLIGLMDIPTKGYIGYANEKVGIDPDAWSAALETEYSDAQQLANRNVSEAEGFTDTLEALWDNPSTILTKTGETIGTLLAGGTIGKGIGAGAKLLGGSTKVSGLLGAALGEGTISAGSAAEDIRNQNEDGRLTTDQILDATASGLGTAAISLASGGLASKLKIADIDSVVAGLSDDVVSKAGGVGKVKSILEGFATEGGEEALQSAQEQMWMNKATGKPILEGVGKSSAEGLVLGSLMGGTINAVSSDASASIEEAVADPKLEAKAAAVKAAEDFVDADNIDDLLDAHGSLTAAKEKVAAIELTEAKAKEVVSATMQDIVSSMEKEVDDNTFTESGIGFTSDKASDVIAEGYVAERDTDEANQNEAKLDLSQRPASLSPASATKAAITTTTDTKEANEGIEEYEAKGVPTTVASESAKVFEEAEPTERMQKVEEVLDAFSNTPETFTSTSGNAFKTKSSLQLSAKNRGIDLSSMDVVQNSDGGWVATAKTERSKAADTAVRSSAATSPITVAELPAETITEYAQNADIRSTATGTSPITQPTISDAVMQESASNSDIRSTATGTAVSSTPISSTDLQGYAADATIRDSATGTTVSNVEPTEAATTTESITHDSANEARYYGSTVNVKPVVSKSGKVIYEGYSGTVDRTVSSSNGETMVEVKPDGIDTTYRLPASRIQVVSLKDNSAATEAKTSAKPAEKVPTGETFTPAAKEYNATAQGQKDMASRGARIAMLKSLNNATGSTYTDAEIDNLSDEDITKVRDSLVEQQLPVKKPVTIVKSDGTPFATEPSAKAALKAKKLDPATHSIIKSGEGWAITNNTAPASDTSAPPAVTEAQPDRTKPNPTVTRFAMADQSEYQAIASSLSAKEVDDTLAYIGEDFDENYTAITKALNEAKEKPAVAKQSASTKEIAEAVGPEVVSVAEPKKEETVAQETKRLERLDSTAAKFTSTPSRDKFSMFGAKQKTVVTAGKKPKLARVRVSTDEAIKNTEKFLRRFVANVPEFKSAPVLTVTTTEKGKVLRFNDSYQFDIKPEVFAIDHKSIKDGDKVRVDIDAWFGMSEDSDVAKYVGFGTVTKRIKQYRTQITNIAGVAWTDGHMVVKGKMPTNDPKLIDGSGYDLSSTVSTMENHLRGSSVLIDESNYATYSDGKDGYIEIGSQTFDKALIEFIIANTSGNKKTSFVRSGNSSVQAMGIKKGDDIVAIVMPLNVPDDLNKSSQGRWTPVTKNKKPTIDGDLFQAIADVTEKTKPAPKLSVSAPASTQSSLSELTPSQREAADALIASGQVEMVTAEEAAKIIGGSEPLLSEDQKVQGFVANGKTSIVAENIESGNLWSVMRHEVGVHVGQLLHSNKEFQLLLKTIASRRNETGKEGDAIRAAFARVPSGTAAANVNEEALAYLVEAAPEVGLARRAIAMVKKFLTSLGIAPSIFTQADLAALADVAIRRQAAQAGPVASSSETRFSISPFTKSISKAKEIALSQGAADLIENTYTYLGDADAPIQFTQKAMGKQVEARDYNLVRRLEGKKVANQIKEFDEKEIAPYIKKLAKAKLTHADTNEFAHAVHAPERNRQMKRVNARQYLDAVLKQFTDKEKEAITARLDEISDDAVMNDKPINEKRDAVIKLAEEVFADYDARVAIADARQAKLDARAFTQEEIDKGTPEYIQKLIDKSRTRLELQKGVIDQWNDVKDRLSGMTNAEAKAIRDKWAADPRYEDVKEAASTLMRWSSENLEIAYEAGELTKEEYEAIKGAYRYHVPLNREDQDATYQVGKKGVGPLTKPIKAATGSTKKVDTIVGHVVSHRQNALARAERLASGKVLYEMVKENGDENFFTIDTPKVRSIPDSEGNIRRSPDHQWDKAHEILVKVDGTTHVITANKDNPRAMNMVKAINRDPLVLGPVMRASQKVTRVLAMLNTTLTPEFMITNFFRDIQTAVINMTDTEAKGMQKRVLRDVGKAWKAINQQEQGKASGPMGDMYSRMKAAGGKIGWMQSYDEVADLAKKLDFDLEVAEGKHWTREKTDKVMKFVERWNTATENAVRLATFSNLVQSGVSDKKAAYIVSNLTVDFTRHGTGGPAINALYMFANAGIQGNIRMVKALVRSPKARKLAGGIFGMGLAANFMGAMMGGDDDDGMSRYDKLKKSRPDLFERNMVFMFPGLDEPVKIPMPYGYNLFYVAGEAVADMVRGKASPLEVSSRIGMAAISVFSPMQGGSILQAISPTLVDPITMAMENKTWYGGDLMPKLYQSDSPNKPDSSRYFSDVNVYAKGVTTFINELTGGSEYRKGFADVSPETIEMLVETYTGSVGRLAKDTFSLATSPLTGEEIGINKIPFVRKVYGGAGKGQDSQIFKENLEVVKTLDKEFKDAEGDEKREIQSDPAFKLRAAAKTTESLIRKTRKNLKAAEEKGDDAAVQRYKDKLNEHYTSFNRRYNAAMGE